MLGWTSLPWLWRIRHPTLVLAGNDDPLVPLINARLHAWLLHDARLHVFDDGHLFMLTHARETAAAIGWVSDRAGTLIAPELLRGPGCRADDPAARSTISRSFACTRSPDATCTASTSASRSAVTWVSIFIASSDSSCCRR